MRVIRTAILGGLAYGAYKAYKGSQTRRSSGRGGTF